ncbi:MAG: hypothetical protein IJW23_03565 [Lentisphaeria bacterium]|nr:hypothetical protein [Lentisphaeria bacterium]
MQELRDIISEYDLVYQAPARGWLDGISIGNGSMCALAYDAGNVFPEWLVNHNKLWDERCSGFNRLPLEHVRKVAAGELSFLEEMSKENPSGERIVPVPVYGAQLRLESGHSATMAPSHRITRHLHLFDGVLETDLSRHLSHPVINSFVCPDKDIMVVQVRNISCMTAYHQRIRLFREAQPEYEVPEFYLEPDAAAFHLKIGTMEYTAAILVKSRPDQPVCFVDLYKKNIRSSSAPAPQRVISSMQDGDSAVISACGNYDIYMSISVTGTPEELIAELRNESEAGSENFLEDHKQHWNDFWKGNEVELSDRGLEQLWYLSNYHMKVAESCTPAWGLCGPWFGRTCNPTQRLPWFGYFTNNYNAQSPVMPLPVINHPELAEGTFKMIWVQLENARKNAEYFGLPGAYYPLSCGPDGKECSSGPYRFCMMSGPYWSTLIYRHYRYTKDKEFLKKYGYDVIREVCRFYAEYLEWEEAEQCYHLRCSQNSELFYLNLPDPIDTLAFVKGAFNAGVECSILFDCDPDDRKKWQHVLDHFPAYPVNRFGFSPLRGLPENHINHSRTLGPVFPVGELDPEFPCGQLEDAKKELYNPTWKGFMFSYCCNDGFTEGWTGKVFHKGIAACRLGAKDVAWKSLCDLITGCVKPNGLIAHNMAQLVDTSLSEKNVENIPDDMEIEHGSGGDPVSIAEVSSGRSEEDATEDPECKEKMYPVLEGPAIYLQLVSEMLMQGYHGLIRLFPAFPDQRDAAFKNLRAEGSLLVSAAKKNGIVQYVKIKALQAQTFQLLNPWEEGKTVYLNGNPVILEHHHSFTLEDGEELILTIGPELPPQEEKRLEGAKAHLIMVEGCRGAFLGKPAPAEYYTGLEQIRTRRLR